MIVLFTNFEGTSLKIPQKKNDNEIFLCFFLSPLSFYIPVEDYFYLIIYLASFKFHQNLNFYFGDFMAKWFDKYYSNPKRGPRHDSLCMYLLGC